MATYNPKKDPTPENIEFLKANFETMTTEQLCAGVNVSVSVLSRWLRELKLGRKPQVKRKKEPSDPAMFSWDDSYFPSGGRRR